MVKNPQGEEYFDDSHTDVAVPRDTDIQMSFADLANSEGLATIDSRDVYSGDDKRDLIGVEFIITDWVERPGVGGGQYVSAEATTTDNRLIVINDGSTGIRDQLRVMRDKGFTKVWAPKGLRVSEYSHPEFGPSQTFYLT